MGRDGFGGGSFGVGAQATATIANERTCSAWRIHRSVTTTWSERKGGERLSRDRGDAFR
jgi:hypothetical protein